MESPYGHLRSARITAIAVLMLFSVANPFTAHAAERPEGDPGDLICGPRCAEFVLSEYGHAADLIELVREAQWPDVEAGCSLADVASILEKRGVYTAAVRVPYGSTLRWPYPVVVHLQPRKGSNLGHFVVWLPCSTRAVCQVWTGLRGVQSGPVGEFWEQSSGTALLTSPEAITGAEPSVKRAKHSFYWIPAFGATCVVGAIAIVSIINSARARIATTPITQNSGGAI